MGHNPSTNRFKQARLGVDAQQAVDEYKARSVWSAWWSLEETLRRRFFTKDERTFITRYGARLDELACHRDNPRNEKEEHFLRVCVGSAEPRSPRERLWILVQLVCRYKWSVDRAARADLAEHDAYALRSENTALKAKNDHLEAYCYRLGRELERATAERPPSTCNVEHATLRFHRRDGSPPIRSFMADPAWRWAPLVLPFSNSAIEQGPLLP